MRDHLNNFNQFKINLIYFFRINSEIVFWEMDSTLKVLEVTSR